MSDLATDLAQEIGNVLQGDLNTYLGGVKTDLKAFLQTNQTEITTWTTQLQNNQITKDDLQDNLLNLKDAFVVTTLTEAGIGAIELQNIINQIIGIVVNKLANTALGFVISVL